VNRSPLFYPMTRGGDSEAGGAADLQTDVMRFMAILSLCLMVIFAVVQSVPVESVQKPESEPPEAPAVIEPEIIVNVPAPVEKTPVVIDSPKPLEPPPKPALQPAQPPTPKPVQAPTPKPVQAAAPADVHEGFSLRFETDQALTQLVSRNEIGLYAITDGKALRMTINQDKAEFWSASLPKRFHEMDTTTVPDSVVRALQTSTDKDNASTKWGVTLPSVMSAKLNTYMQDYKGGALVIGADGILRMEP
jgi:outer membrane biosynthesis protein TonB